MKKLILFSLVGFIFILGCSPGERIYPQSTPGSSGHPINLSWSSNLGEQQGFYIEESTDGTNFSQILNVPDGTNTASVIAPTSGKYYFRIRGYNQTGDSPYSQVVSASI